MHSCKNMPLEYNPDEQVPNPLVGGRRGGLPMNTKNVFPKCHRYAVVAGLSLVLASSAVTSTPLFAFADNQDTASENSATAQQLDTTNSQASSSLSDALALTSGVQTNRVLDLRSLGVVTSVKNQSPWQTCWAFASISAAETSILSEAKAQGIDLSTIDLSELQVAALAYNYSGVPESVAGSAQAGEGYYSTSKNPNLGIDTGGTLAYVSSAFAAGIGPVAESDAEYKNSDDVITWVVSGDNIGELVPGATGPVTFTNPTEDEFKTWQDLGLTYVKAGYAGTYYTKGSETEDSKEAYADWSVDESLWQKSLYEFTDGNILPETRIMKDGVCTGTDMSAVATIKSELDSGRAVAVSLHADDTVPSADPKVPIPGKKTYLNANWAHYTYDTETINHGVTIVGYDDTYSRTNFSDGENNLPEGDGAWIVKNSFGSQTEDFPNNQGLTPDWGITDADGKHTGYFYVSYYDKSISNFETFEFDLSISNVGADTGRIIDQYDYLPVAGTTYGTFTNQVSAANIFTADADMAVRALWCETTSPNSTVTLDVYLLDSDATDPTDAEHSRKVFSATDTYTYAGYHRYKIDDDSWIALRKGQRYSVVVTQKHQAEDGSWVYTVPVNYNTSVETKVDYTYDEQTGDLVPSTEWDAGFIAKVNAGESWVMSSVDVWTTDAEKSTGIDSWTDWSLITTALTEKNKTTVFDNQPIKAYAQAQNWASIDELSQLEDAIAKAKALLESVTVSADGKDVPTDKQWMAQAEYNELKAEIDEAEAVLAKAGSDYKTVTLMTTPTSDDANEQVANLSTFEAEVSAVLKPGTKQADKKSNEKSDKKDKGSKGTIPQTGDATSSLFAFALTGIATLTAGIFSSKKRQE